MILTKLSPFSNIIYHLADPHHWQWGLAKEYIYIVAKKVKIGLVK